MPVPGIVNILINHFGVFAFAIKPNQGEWGLTDLVRQQRRLSLAKGVLHPWANGS